MAPRSGSFPSPDAPGGGGARVAEVPRLLVRGLHAGYPRHGAVLRDVSLQGRAGEIVAVVGANGAGKTTLFRVLLGFLGPRAGEVLLDGRAPAALRVQVGVGYLPDAVAFPGGWSGIAVLREGVRLSLPRRADAEGALRIAIRRTGLTPGELARPVHLLSRGMARRVGLAAALAGDPGVILLDEPLAGLDAPGRKRLRAEVMEAARRGAVVVVTSHDLPEIQRLAHRVVVLRGGRVLDVFRAGDADVGRMEELLEGPA